MTTASVGISTALRPAVAAERAAGDALAALAGEAPDAAIVAVTAAWGSDSIVEVIDATAKHIGCDAIVGCSVEGVLAKGREVSHNPAVAVLALAGVEASVQLAEGLAGDEKRAGAELAAAIPGGPAPDDLLLLFADSIGLAHSALADGLDAELPGLRLMGIGATEPSGAAPLVWADGDVVSEGCAALLLRGRKPPTLAVTTGARVVGDVLRVSRASGNWVLGLDGQPALDVLSAQVPALLRDAEGRPGPSCLLGLLPEARPGRALDPGALRIRNLIGFDDARRGFALPEPLESGAAVALVALDGDTARADLERLLTPLGASDSRAGVYFTCSSRGESLFRHAGIEIAYLERALGDLPLLGLMGGYQLARPEPDMRAQVHIQAGVLALLGD
jgi:small ligand-binding sensory domain FIST